MVEREGWGSSRGEGGGPNKNISVPRRGVFKESRRGPKHSPCWVIQGEDPSAPFKHRQANHRACVRRLFLFTSAYVRAGTSNWRAASRKTPYCSSAPSESPARCSTSARSKTACSTCARAVIYVYVNRR